VEKESCIVKHESVGSTWSLGQRGIENRIRTVMEVTTATKYNETTTQIAHRIVLEIMGIAAE